MGFLEVFRVFLYMFRGVPGFLEGVLGCSGFFTLFRVFRGVPVFRCSGVPAITTCPSRVPFSFVFAELTDGTKRDLCHGSK